MSIVSLIRCETYNSPELEGAVRRAVDLCGGMEKYVRPGDRVLIKPNMLSAHPPDRRITTDPAVLRAVLLLVLDAGGKPVVSDSPAMDSFRRVAGKTGLGEVARNMGVDMVELDRPTRVGERIGATFKAIDLAAPILESDVVINLPKLKTHSQMLLTLGVKNLFGSVVGRTKAEWHMMVGMDRVDFATLLLDIYHAVNPGLTILDGVWGMDGRGPANGAPKFIGLIGASEDAPALDFTICRLLGVPLNKFPLFRAAEKHGLPQTDPSNIKLTGDTIEAPVVPAFALPDSAAIMPLPGFLNNLIRRRLVSKPRQKTTDCVQCGQCIDICPADAIRFKGSRLLFDYSRCIRCYCCQEVCPRDAIGFQRGFLVRFLNLLGL